MTITTAAHVMLVDDQPLLRESLQRHLHNLFPQAQLHNASTGSDALVKLASQPVHLLISELFLPDMHSFVLLQRLQVLTQPPITVLLACGATAETQANARRLQVRALLNKRISGQQLESSLQRALDGETIYEAFQPHGRSCGNPASSLDLTPREFDVLLYLARGLSNKQIETALTMSASTLKTHLRSLFDKFAVNNRTACLVSARQAGFL